MFLRVALEPVLLIVLTIILALVIHTIQVANGNIAWALNKPTYCHTLHYDKTHPKPFIIKRHSSDGSTKIHYKTLSPSRAIFTLQALKQCDRAN